MTRKTWKILTTKKILSEILAVNIWTVANAFTSDTIYRVTTQMPKQHHTTICHPIL